MSDSHNPQAVSHAAPEDCATGHDFKAAGHDAAQEARPRNVNATDIDPETGFRRPPTITVHLQPEEKTFEMPRVKNAGQLLVKLGIRPATALVARDGELLTPDRAINHKDHILVRKVISRG